MKSVLRHRSGTAIGAVVGGTAIALVVVLVSGGLAPRVTGRQRSGSTPPSPSSSPAIDIPSATGTRTANSGPILAPIVPVVSFWSPRRDISVTEVVRLWAGMANAAEDPGYTSIAVTGTVAAEMAAEFDIPPASNVHVVDSAANVMAAARTSAETLGLLDAADVGPQVMALSVSGFSLFGSERIKDLAMWPLLAPATSPTTFAVDSEWTLDAGGDVNLDRGVYTKSVELGYGPDFPWSAGHAVVSGYEGGGFENAPLVVARDTGPQGYFTQRFGSADLTLVNLEGPAPNDWITRKNSLVFTFDPALLIGLKDAGIDAVTLANNHIRNGGDQGVIDTCANLDKIGLAHTGAGANITAARQPVWLSAGGERIAVLGYSAVGGDNWASDSHPGAAPLDPDYVVADIHAARAAGAGIVVVMPHWGEEYSYSLSAEQESEAATFVAAGADLILGSHSHWVGGIETIDRPEGTAFVDYSMGDLLFNLNHDVEAQEGVVVTATFAGTRLLQVTLDPTIMIDQAQVGLTDPAGDGLPVLQAIRKASRGLTDW
jgi:poly-gamma-glutamate synthesis protein (capsule biosynthesis protein)